MDKEGKVGKNFTAKTIKNVTRKDNAREKLSKSNKQELISTKPKSYGIMRRVAKKKK